MTGILEPGGCARRSLLRRALGAGVVVLIGTVARKAAAREDEVVIDNFTFSPTPLIVTVGSDVKWVNHDDIPHSIVCPALNVASTGRNEISRCSSRDRSEAEAAPVRISSPA